MQIKRFGLFLLMLSLATAPQAAETGWVIITGEVCNVRSKPDSSSKLVTELQTFAPVKLLGEQEGEYYKIELHGGATGWAHEKVLGKYGYASAKPGMINWRTGPGKQFDVKYELNNPDFYPVRVLDRQGEYVLTVDIEKDKGWMHSSMLTIKPYCAISAEKANILVDASEEAEVRFHATKGVVFEILNQKGDWLEVKHRDGNSGWVNFSEVWGGKKIASKDMPAASRPTVKSSTKPSTNSDEEDSDGDKETASEEPETKTSEKVTKTKKSEE